MVNFAPTSILSSDFTIDSFVSTKAIKKAPLPKPTQTQLVASMIAFTTSSTKPPYIWNKIDGRWNLPMEILPDEFENFLNALRQYKNAHDFMGIQIVTFYTDIFNVEQNTVMPEFCFTEYKPKTKTYINGKNADKSFLAKKGNVYTNKNSV